MKATAVILFVAPAQAAIVILGREDRYFDERFARGRVQPR